MTMQAEQRRGSIAFAGVLAVAGAAALIHVTNGARGVLPRAPLASMARTVPAPAPTVVGMIGVVAIQRPAVRQPGSVPSRLASHRPPPHFVAPDTRTDEAIVVLADALDSAPVLPRELVFTAPTAEPDVPHVAAVATKSTSDRGLVTSAFVTAGSAVAGSFRSAGRAIKRAF